MLSNDQYRFLPLRRVPVDAAAGRRYKQWIHELDEELADPGTDRNELCRRVLGQLFFPVSSPVGLGAGAGTANDPEALPLAAQVTLDQLDPRRITLEPEYYAETDLDRYYQVKPLIWLWEMFDKSVLGENVHLGVLFRRMLAKRIFARCGRNFKAFHFVKLTFGYGLEVGNDVVVHRHVLLDDRGGIRIGDGASVSDFVNVYSHSHHTAESRDIRTPQTVIGDGVRIAYHATVLAGTTLAPNSMIGAGALVTKNTEPDTVYGGIPARPLATKPERPRPPPTIDPLARE